MEYLTLSFRDGIASSAVAAAIKFGLEALPGVRAVHFQADAVEVLIEGESARTQDFLDVLASAGIDPEMVDVLASEATECAPSQSTGT